MTAPHRDPETLRRLYHGEGLSLQGVADRLGCSRMTVHRWMKRHGIERRGAGAGSGREHPHWVERATFNHHRRGYERWTSQTDRDEVLVHRLAAVAWFGYEAVVGNHVHHENGIPWDNRETNLRTLSASDHARLHGQERAEELSEQDSPRDAAGRFTTAEADAHGD